MWGGLEGSEEVPIAADSLNPFVSSEVETRCAGPQRPSTSLGTNGGENQLAGGSIALEIP
jgi:hypothetical protein